MFNPYAQAGWPNPQNPLATAQSVHPSTTLNGALPFAFQTPTSQLLSFTFESYNRDILCSTIYGPNDQKYFDIWTSASPNQISNTVIRKSDGSTVATIEWFQHPVVDINGFVARQPVCQWLPVAGDRSFRTMSFRGRQFAWMPTGNTLYVTGPASELISQISRSRDSVTVKMSSEAFRLGLLEIVIVATLLLQSNRNVD
ncbi:hypothetical protein BDQ17DRAFT_1245216 [Cyathus striatus]|nr:hypothetical protein BDQ17DRAFT_1245216 [Cyathus striatus]